MNTSQYPSRTLKVDELKGLLVELVCIPSVYLHIIKDVVLVMGKATFVLTGQVLDDYSVCHTRTENTINECFGMESEVAFGLVDNRDGDT